MRENDEKILKYLDGHMNSREKTEFEEELLHSEELRTLFDQYNSVYNLVGTERNKKLKLSYAESIIPAFRRRIESHKPGVIKVRFTYAMSVIIIIASAFYILNLRNAADSPDLSDISVDDVSNKDIEIFLEETATDNNFLSSFSYNFHETIDSIFIRHYSDAVIASETPEESLFALNDLDYQQIENFLSEEEIDIVYIEIINKTLF